MGYKPATQHVGLLLTAFDPFLSPTCVNFSGRYRCYTGQP